MRVLCRKISTKCAFFRSNELNKRNNSNHKLGDEQYGRIFVWEIK